ncbi:MAG: DUF2955 domain-containing protein [Pseudomonadota bacterium]
MSPLDRHSLRLALTMALSLVLSYGLSYPLPYLTPIFVVFLAANPEPPIKPRALFLLLLVVTVSLALGVLMVPLLQHYNSTGVLFVGLGLFLSLFLTIVRGKRVLGMFLIIGLTLVSAAGYQSYALATVVISSLVLSIATAVATQWLVFLFLPGLPTAPDATPSGSEDDELEAAVSDTGDVATSWAALRAALIVMPAYLMALSNPSQYLMTIMKSVSLSQQSSAVDLRTAGRELIGSTFAGGVMAVLFWKLLQLAPTLWMFFLWMLAFSLYASAKLFGQLQTRFAPSFWINSVVTMLILIGPAVQDSSNGNDAWSAFLVRFGVFLGVTIYAWVAVHALEALKARYTRPTRSFG